MQQEWIDFPQPSGRVRRLNPHHVAHQRDESLDLLLDVRHTQFGRGRGRIADREQQGDRADELRQSAEEAEQRLHVAGRLAREKAIGDLNPGVLSYLNNVINLCDVGKERIPEFALTSSPLFSADPPE